MDSSYITGIVKKKLIVYTYAELPRSILEQMLPGESLADSIEETGYYERVTEVQALQPHISRPPKVAWRCLELARIAMQPGAYPQVQDKPVRAQTGDRLLNWIGKRVGISAEDVEVLLERVDEYIRAEG